MDKATPLVIGTRGSRLALAQAEQIQADLARLCLEDSFQITVIKTQGDNLQDVALAKVGGKGFFTKELESALLADEIDLAVHSLKDLPVELPAGLKLGAVTKRVDPWDVLIRREEKAKEGKRGGRGLKVGTSSLRRKAQLLAWRQDWEVVDLRGNLDTRLRKLLAGEYDAIVVALAGLQRLKLTDLPYEVLSTAVMLPAPAQGALGIQIRADDSQAASLVEKLHDPATALTTGAERSLLSALEGGCQVPIGAWAHLSGQTLKLMGNVVALDGKKQVSGQVQREVTSVAGALALGQELARELRAKGAQEILWAIKNTG